MNSVQKHITPATIASTLITMRSGRKEVFLIVEGSEDIKLYSNIFGVSRSNFISCNGKENLMALFMMVPRRGLDEGTIFIRDRDFDDITNTVNDSIVLLVSDLYDLEMHLLSGRLFSRIFSEYLAEKADEAFIKNAYTKIVGLAALIGALRKYSQEQKLSLNFDELSFNFVDVRTLEIDCFKMLNKISARSHVNLGDLDAVTEQIKKDVHEALNVTELACGKDVLILLNLAFSKHYKCCNSHECSPNILAKMLRIAATIEDISRMSLFKILAMALPNIPYSWPGIPLVDGLEK